MVPSLLRGARSIRGDGMDDRERLMLLLSLRSRV
jgi:hypothetical protein